MFLALAIFLQGSQGFSSPAFAATDWSECQKRLLSISGSEAAQGAENVVLAAYESIVFDAGKDLISKADLVRMLESGDYFSISDAGNSSRDHLTGSLRQLKGIADGLSIDRVHLEEKIRRLLLDACQEKKNESSERARLERVKDEFKTVVLPHRERQSSWADRNFLSVDARFLVELAYQYGRLGRSALLLVRAVDIATGGIVSLFDGDLPGVKWVVASLDQRYVAFFFSTSDFRTSDVRVLDLNTMAMSEVVAKVDFEKLDMKNTAFSLDGSRLFIWSAKWSDDSMEYLVESVDWKASLRSRDAFILKGKKGSSLSWKKGPSYEGVKASSPDAKHLVFFPQNPGGLTQMEWMNREDQAQLKRKSFGSNFSDINDSYHFLMSRDGKWLVRHSNSRLKEIWSLSPEPQKVGELGGGVFGKFGFSPDEKFIVSENSAVFETATAKGILKGTSGNASEMHWAFSGNSEWFARQVPQRQIEVYDAKTWKLICQISVPSWDFRFYFSFDGKRLIFESTKTGARMLKIYDVDVLADQ